MNNYKGTSMVTRMTHDERIQLKWWIAMLVLVAFLLLAWVLIGAPMEVRW